MTGVTLRLASVASVVGALALGGAAFAPARDQGGAVAAEPAAPSLRVQVLAHVDPGGGLTGDVVAHRGYAYLSSYRGRECPAQGVRVYDLRNPRSPRHVATFADGDADAALADTWTEKTIVRRVRTSAFTGDLAVTSIQGCVGRGNANPFRGFGLYDVTNTARPRKLALVHLDPRGSHEIWLAAARGGAWVYTAILNSEVISSPDFNPSTGDATTPGMADFRIFDVSDPEQPAQVGEWGAWRELGISPRAGRGRLAANIVHSVIANSSATRAYLSYWDLGTVILDIRNPRAPRYLGRTPAVDEEGDAHSAWLARGGKVLIETHENPAGRPYLFDISDPARPGLLSRFGPLTADGTTIWTGVHDPKVLGKRAYFSWYNRGVVVADISKPRRPRQIARFVPTAQVPPDSTFGAACTPACTLTWGVFPTKSYVLASDLVSGLWVFRLR
jgi:hypothetical protein